MTGVDEIITKATHNYMHPQLYVIESTQYKVKVFYTRASFPKA